MKATTPSTCGGSDTVFAGQGNDSAFVSNAPCNPLYFMNEGNDTVDGGTSTCAMTVMGGNDSADGSDSIWSGSGADIIFGQRRQRHARRR